MLVALAGPMSNLTLAIVITIILKILIVFGAEQYLFTGAIGKIIYSMIITTISFNVIFAIFNMIPIPPFDGSKVLLYVLPYKWKDIMYKLEQYSFIILLLLFVTRAHMIIITPIYSVIMLLLSLILNI